MQASRNYRVRPDSTTSVRLFLSETARSAPHRLGGTIGPAASARWDKPVENRPQDIAAAKSALYWAAYQPDDPASLPQTDYDADLSNTIHNFQAINGLKRDGPPLTYGSGGRRRRGRLL